MGEASHPGPPTSIDDVVDLTSELTETAEILHDYTASTTTRHPTSCAGAADPTDCHAQLPWWRSHAEWQWLHECDLSLASSCWPEPPTRQPDPLDFDPSPTFTGARDLAYFGTGPRGTGYYSDTPVARQQRSDARERASLLDADQRFRYLRDPPLAHELRDPSDGLAPRDVQLDRQQPSARTSGATPAAPPDRPRHTWFHTRTPPRREQACWAFDTVNANCASSALQFLSISGADVCFLQETRVAGDQRLRLERNAAQSKWSLTAADAV